MAKNEKMYNKGRFVFVGDPIFGRDNVVTTAKLNATSEWNKTRLNFGVKVGNNSQFLTTEYLHSDKVNKIKLFDKEGKEFEVPLNETNNPELLNRVYTKITVNLETDQEVKKQYNSLVFKKRNHEIKQEQTEDDIQKIKEYTEQLEEFSSNVANFIHMKDFINFINASQEVIKGHKIKVTGEVKSNFYNNTNHLQFIPKNVEFVLGDDVKEELTVYMDIFFDKDAIDDDKKEKKMFVNGYVGETVRKADKLFPTQVIFDYSKADLENEKQKALVDFVKGFFEVKNKKVLHRLPVICQVINGAEVVEFDESQLTDKQKTAIALGLATLDQYKPKGSIFGERVSFIKVIQPDLKLSPEGVIESIDLDELVNYLPSDDSDKKVEDMKKEDKKETKEEEKKDNEIDQNDMMRALFG